MENITEEGIALDIMFKAYCSMDPISKTKNLELLPLSQCHIWFEAAKLLDPVNVTSTDIGLCFFKFHKRAINYEEFLKFLKNFTQTKGLNIDLVKNKLQTCPIPEPDTEKEESDEK